MSARRVRRPSTGDIAAARIFSQSILCARKSILCPEASPVCESTCPRLNSSGRTTPPDKRSSDTGNKSPENTLPTPHSNKQNNTPDNGPLVGAQSRINQETSVDVESTDGNVCSGNEKNHSLNSSGKSTPRGRGSDRTDKKNLSTQSSTTPSSDRKGQSLDSPDCRSTSVGQTNLTGSRGRQKKCPYSSSTARNQKDNTPLCDKHDQSLHPSGGVTPPVTRADTSASSGGSVGSNTPDCVLQTVNKDQQTDDSSAHRIGKYPKKQSRYHRSREQFKSVKQKLDICEEEEGSGDIVCNKQETGPESGQEGKATAGESDLNCKDTELSERNTSPCSIDTQVNEQRTKTDGIRQSLKAESSEKELNSVEEGDVKCTEPSSKPPPQSEADKSRPKGRIYGPKRRSRTKESGEKSSNAQNGSAEKLNVSEDISDPMLKSLASVSSEEGSIQGVSQGLDRRYSEPKTYFDKTGDKTGDLSHPGSRECDSRVVKVDKVETLTGHSRNIDWTSYKNCQSPADSWKQSEQCPISVTQKSWSKKSQSPTDSEKPVAHRTPSKKGESPSETKKNSSGKKKNKGHRNKGKNRESPHETFPRSLQFHKAQSREGSVEKHLNHQKNTDQFGRRKSSPRTSEQHQRGDHLWKGHYSDEKDFDHYRVTSSQREDSSRLGGRNKGWSSVDKPGYIREESGRREKRKGNCRRSPEFSSKDFAEMKRRESPPVDAELAKRGRGRGWPRSKGRGSGHWRTESPDHPPGHRWVRRTPTGPGGVAFSPAVTRDDYHVSGEAADQEDHCCEGDFGSISKPPGFQVGSCPPLALYRDCDRDCREYHADNDRSAQDNVGDHREVSVQHTKPDCDGYHETAPEETENECYSNQNMRGHHLNAACYAMEPEATGESGADDPEHAPELHVSGKQKHPVTVSSLSCDSSADSVLDDALSPRPKSPRYDDAVDQLNNTETEEAPVYISTGMKESTDGVVRGDDDLIQQTEPLGAQNSYSQSFAHTKNYPFAENESGRAKPEKPQKVALYIPPHLRKQASMLLQSATTKVHPVVSASESVPQVSTPELCPSPKCPGMNRVTFPSWSKGKGKRPGKRNSLELVMEAYHNTVSDNSKESEDEGLNHHDYPCRRYIIGEKPQANRHQNSQTSIAYQERTSESPTDADQEFAPSEASPKSRETGSTSSRKQFDSDCCSDFEVFDEQTNAVDGHSGSASRKTGPASEPYEEVPEEPDHFEYKEALSRHTQNVNSSSDSDLARRDHSEQADDVESQASFSHSDDVPRFVSQSKKQCWQSSDDVFRPCRDRAVPGVIRLPLQSSECGVESPQITVEIEPLKQHRFGPPEDGGGEQVYGSYATKTGRVPGSVAAQLPDSYAKLRNFRTDSHFHDHQKLGYDEIDLGARPPFMDMRQRHRPMKDTYFTQALANKPGARRHTLPSSEHVPRYMNPRMGPHPSARGKPYIGKEPHFEEQTQNSYADQWRYSGCRSKNIGDTLNVNVSVNVTASYVPSSDRNSHPRDSTYSTSPVSSVNLERTALLPTRPTSVSDQGLYHSGSSCRDSVYENSFLRRYSSVTTPTSSVQSTMPMSAISHASVTPDHSHRCTLVKSASEGVPRGKSRTINSSGKFDWFDMEESPEVEQTFSNRSGGLNAETHTSSGGFSIQSSPSYWSLFNYKGNSSDKASPTVGATQRAKQRNTDKFKPIVPAGRARFRWSDIHSQVALRCEYREYAQGSNWKQRFQSRFSRVRIPYVDTHCHLDFLFSREEFKGTFTKYIATHKETFPSNFKGCVAVFCDPRTFNGEGGLWKDVLCESNVWGAVGCHPKCTSSFSAKAEMAMRVMLQHDKMVAVGEIGLDYSKTNFYNIRDRQKEVFERQLNIAIDLKKPVVIHSRDAEEDTIDVLENMEFPKDIKIHRHCFTGSWSQAERWLHLFPKSYIGLTPLVTHVGDRAIPCKEVARNIPLNRLLLETDAPYFTPRRIPRDEMPLSHPGMAITVAAEVAELRNISIDEVLVACLENTKDMYGI